MRFLLSSLALGLLFAAPLGAEDRPVVVELFTSQGCPACPPADAYLMSLGEREDVLPLALHVDYWDYIGWEDEFASPEHTARQRAYAETGGRSMVYTPQMVLNGQDHVVGTRVRDVEALIKQHKSEPRDTVTLRLEREDHVLRIHAVSRVPHDAPLEVQVIRYLPQETAEITRGENAGKVLNYSHIVTDLRALDPWDTREALEREVDLMGYAPVVVLVQQPGHGPIEAAARLR